MIARRISSSTKLNPCDFSGVFCFAIMALSFLLRVDKDIVFFLVIFLYQVKQGAQVFS